ncbi:MAG: carbohydrate kinase family protein [Planctomycetaceae bacterium]|jgi:sugar/nucleoside kinase (ribokinase family)|nr:carbohydrate kinase family protein [Planctomycetaceae bacterium]
MTLAVKKHDCLCLGILFADVVCQPISHLPTPGELVPTERVELSLGGCASNVAINLSRFNLSVGLSGCIGDDPFSDYIAGALTKTPGIDVSRLRRVRNMGPGTSMIINVHGEDRRFISANGANAEYHLHDLPEEWLAPETIIYIGGFLMTPKLEAPETIDVLKLARRRGCRILLDVVLYGDRPYLDAIAPLLPYADAFLPNDHEAEKITGLTNPIEQAKFFLDAGTQAAIITCGEKGTYYFSQREKFHVDIFPTNYVGGTGAGDAFNSGYIAALHENLTPRECVVWGNALGASCVRHISATQSVFNRDELQRFLETRSAQCRDL